MKIRVCWKDIEFLVVEKKNELYFSKINVENYDKVVSQGCPVAFLDNIKVIDDELPNIIVNRLPRANFLIDKVNKDEDLEQSIIEYINKTKCKRVTDYITLDIV